MLFTWLQALEQVPAVAALRGSLWAYPLVNAAHIVGIAALFGAILPLDLRLAGLFRQVPVATLRRVLVPVATGGLMLAICAGALLFACKAGDYARAPLFQAKMVLVALGVGNALALRRTRGWRDGDDGSGSGGSGSAPAVAAWPRVAAAASLLLWLGAIVLGRLIGYF